VTKREFPESMTGEKQLLDLRAVSTAALVEDICSRPEVRSANDVCIGGLIRSVAFLVSLA
jgi:hypothetical protein